MAYPSTIDAPDTSMQGTTLVASDDHAASHRLLGSATINIENKLGVGSGSAALNTILVGQGAGTATWGTVWNNGVLGTPSITGGTISGAAVSGTFNNALLGTPTIQAWDGWIQETATWSSLGTDTKTGTVSVNADVTGKYQAGYRLKYTMGGSVHYGIVTNVGALSGGSVPVTFYGGTYVLGTTAITNPFFSPNKVPFGFNPDPAIWQEVVTDTTTAQQSSPGVGTWYNLGTISLTVPLGKWRLFFNVAGAANLPGSNCGLQVALSTGTNTASDSDLIASGWSYNSFTTQLHREKFLSLGTKTPYYLNANPIFASQTNIQYRGDIASTKIVAVCDLL